MSHQSARRRVGGAVGIVAAVSLTVALAAPTAANAERADDAASYAHAQLIGVPDSLTEGLSTEDLAAIAGAELSHAPSYPDPRDNADFYPDGTDWANPDSGNSNAISVSPGVNVSLLGSLGLPEIAIGTLGIASLGDLLQVDAGAVTQYAKTTRYGSSVGFAGTASAMEGAIDALKSGEAYNLDARVVEDAPAATLDLDAGIVNVSAEIGALYALAFDNKIDGNVAHDSAYGIAGVDFAVGGTLLEDVLSPVLDLLAEIGGVLGLNLSLQDLGVMDSEGRIVVSIDDLLEQAGVASVNDLPEGTNLIEYLPDAVVAVVDTAVHSLIDDIDVGLLGPVVNPLLSAVVNLLSTLSGDLATPLAGELGALLALNVNNVDDDGTVITATALKVDILEGAIVLPLATATAGANEWQSFQQGDVTLDGTLRSAQRVYADVGGGWLPDTVDRHDEQWYSYQWYADGEPIMLYGANFPDGRLANGRSVWLNTDQIGKEITVGITPHLWGNFDTEEFVSAPFGTVESHLVSTSSTPTIIGTGEVGNTLRADFGTVTPSSAFDASKIVWMRDGKRIRTGGDTFTVRDVDRGGEISFRFVFNEDGWAGLRGESANTISVE